MSWTKLPIIGSQLQDKGPTIDSTKFAFNTEEFAAEGPQRFMMAACQLSTRYAKEVINNVEIGQPSILHGGCRVNN